jgi:lipoate-protein ligase A
VITEACRADGVSIQRRCTAGGCVLQAPGCLNYAFVLRMDREGCDTIHGSYKVILGWIADALGSIGQRAALAGISDLALGPHKVSGNAQKRKRRHFLHHGTLLYAFDARLCSKYEKVPADEPAYRAQRGHEAFLRNLEVSRADLVKAVSRLFRAEPELNATRSEMQQSSALASEKYRRPDWVYRR